MKPARILLLIVAVVAGGLAAFLATRGDQPQTTQVANTKVVHAPQTRILIAARNIGVGQRLAADTVKWHDWPDSAVMPEYVTAKTMPDAIKTMSGAVARFEIFAGEPITASKIVRSDQGYLSAVIDEGMRAVSIPVSPASGAGGFIVPNDRVDVILTSRSSQGEVSRTILSNVRVLAIGKRLGETDATGKANDKTQNQGFDRSTIATFELNPAQAETIINAASTGKLTLVLRSVADFKGGSNGIAERGSHAVTVIRFGQPTSVQSGAGNEPQATVNPAAYSNGLDAPIRSSLPATQGTASDAQAPTPSQPVSQPVTPQ